MTPKTDLLFTIFTILLKLFQKIHELFSAFHENLKFFHKVSEKKIEKEGCV